MLRGILGQLLLPKVGIKNLGLGKSHGVWEIGNFQKKQEIRVWFCASRKGEARMGPENAGRVGKEELVEFCGRIQGVYQGLDGPWSTQGKWEL